MEKSDIDIRYVEELARLEIPDGQAAALQKDLENIVAYIAELGELDLTGVEPTAHAAPLSNVWREDVAGEPFGRERMLANAPALMNGDLIRVPQVLPGEGMN